jgi:acetyl esterase/lipase
MSYTTITYGSGGSSQVLDLYESAGATGPAVVLAHGGLWQSGDRAELSTICAALASGGLSCATIDYTYSQDLGGCCMSGCTETYTAQAALFADAVAEVTSRGFAPAFVGGHSAGGHLAMILALRWQEFAPSATPPAGFIGLDGIYDVGVWDAYQLSFWSGWFTCTNQKAFGFSSAEWASGSPTSLAASLVPAAPVLLIHSPGDDWVQSRQATEFYNALAPPPRGAHRLDVGGTCASGSHSAMLTGSSSALVVGCISELIAESLRPEPPPPALPSQAPPPDQPPVPSTSPSTSPSASPSAPPSASPSASPSLAPTAAPSVTVPPAPPLAPPLAPSPRGRDEGGSASALGTGAVAAIAAAAGSVALLVLLAVVTSCARRKRRRARLKSVLAADV